MRKNMADGMARRVGETTPAQRLRQARERGGYENASDFARAAQVNYTTYAHHENGRRPITADVARLYGRLLKLPPGMLLFGDALPAHSPVPIVGIVSTSGKIEPASHRHSQPPTTTLPDPYDLVGMLVQGDDLYPAYRDGDVVYHRPLSSDGYAIEALHGLECVVQRIDGSLLLRQVSVQSDGRVTLLAYHAPPLIDQVLIAGSPVEIVQRRLPARLSNH
jgi:DNA-binding XRE family transcriptional regulator